MLEKLRLWVRPVVVFAAVVLPFVWLTTATRPRDELLLLGVVLGAAYLAFEVALALTRADRKHKRIMAEVLDMPDPDSV